MLASDSDPEKCLRTTEGDDSMPWPPSPPIQQLMTEQRGDSRVALGIGMAGSSHWSISFEPIDHKTILVDNACKTNGPPQFLGSTFSAPGFNESLAIGQYDSLVTGNLKFIISQSILKTDGSGTIIVTPADSPDCQTNHTYRWKYKLTVG